MDIESEVLAALRRIGRRMALQSRHLVRCNGLTGPQSLLLVELSKTDRLKVGELARRLNVCQATVTAIIRRLEQRGLVNRRRSESDGRQVNVTLTADGADLVRSSPPLLQEAFLRRFKELDEWEQLQLVSSLHRVAMMMEVDSDPPPIKHDIVTPRIKHVSPATT